jgi:hypothetical protein
MYNKLFTKILDSSIWLEPSGTRIIWLTMIAAMDENGFVQFASVANLAHRARIELAEAQAAVDCLEGPDTNSSDPDHEGRRIERVPGGWMILNAEKYREMVTRAVIQEKTRQRVAKHRTEKKRACNASVTHGNASVTESNACVTPSDTDTGAATKAASTAFQPEEPSPASTKPRGVVEGKNSDRLPLSEQSKRIAAMFNRRLTTEWSKKEVESYRNIGTVDEGDLSLMEDYYKAPMPPDADYRRRDLLTCLNNWQGEVDRARKWAALRTSPAKPAASYYLPGVGMVNAK